MGPSIAAIDDPSLVFSRRPGVRRAPDDDDNDSLGFPAIDTDDDSDLSDHDDDDDDSGSLGIPTFAADGGGGGDFVDDADNFSLVIVAHRDPEPDAAMMPLAMGFIQSTTLGSSSSSQTPSSPRNSALVDAVQTQTQSTDNILPAVDPTQPSVSSITGNAAGMTPSTSSRVHSVKLVLKAGVNSWWGEEKEQGADFDANSRDAIRAFAGNDALRSDWVALYYDDTKNDSGDDTDPPVLPDNSVKHTNPEAIKARLNAYRDVLEMFGARQYFSTRTVTNELVYRRVPRKDPFNYNEEVVVGFLFHYKGRHAVQDMDLLYGTRSMRHATGKGTDVTVKTRNKRLPMLTTTNPNHIALLIRRDPVYTSHIKPGLKSLLSRKTCRRLEKDVTVFRDLIRDIGCATVPKKQPATRRRRRQQQQPIIVVDNDDAKKAQVVVDVDVVKKVPTPEQRIARLASARKMRALVPKRVRRQYRRSIRDFVTRPIRDNAISVDDANLQVKEWEKRLRAMRDLFRHFNPDFRSGDPLRVVTAVSHMMEVVTEYNVRDLASKQAGPLSTRLRSWFPLGHGPTNFHSRFLLIQQAHRLNLQTPLVYVALFLGTTRSSVHGNVKQVHLTPVHGVVTDDEWRIVLTLELMSRYALLDMWSLTENIPEAGAASMSDKLGWNDGSFIAQRWSTTQGSYVSKSVQLLTIDDDDDDDDDDNILRWPAQNDQTSVWLRGNAFRFEDDNAAPAAAPGRGAGVDAGVAVRAGHATSGIQDGDDDDDEMLTAVALLSNPNLVNASEVTAYVWLLSDDDDDDNKHTDLRISNDRDLIVCDDLRVSYVYEPAPRVVARTYIQSGAWLCVMYGAVTAAYDPRRRQFAFDDQHTLFLDQTTMGDSVTKYIRRQQDVDRQQPVTANVKTVLDNSITSDGGYVMRLQALIDIEPDTEIVLQD